MTFSYQPNAKQAVRVAAKPKLPYPGPGEHVEIDGIHYVVGCIADNQVTILEDTTRARFIGLWDWKTMFGDPAS